MKTTVSLNEEQMATIKQTQTNFRNNLKAIHKHDGLLKEEKKMKSKALKEQLVASIRNVLLPEQLAKFDSLRVHRHKNGKMNQIS